MIRELIGWNPNSLNETDVYFSEDYYEETEEEVMTDQDEPMPVVLFDQEDDESDRQ